MNVSFERRATGSKDEWLTPPEIIKALGTFDLDPCAPLNRPWDIAKQHYTKKDDGQKCPGKVGFGAILLMVVQPENGLKNAPNMEMLLP